jgi:hypothetical protein
MTNFRFPLLMENMLKMCKTMISLELPDNVTKIKYGVSAWITLLEKSMVK